MIGVLLAAAVFVGGTRFTVRLWAGERYDTVIDQGDPR